MYFGPGFARIGHAGADFDSFNGVDRHYRLGQAAVELIAPRSV
jgi:hypothetical protein